MPIQNISKKLIKTTGNEKNPVGYQCHSNFLAGDQKVMDCIASSEIVYLSAIVLGELYAGFRGGKKYSENCHYLNQFLQKPTIHELDASHETSEIFGQIKYNLKKAGTPLPINDVWIAAQAVETSSVIITYDKHFTKIPGIRLWDL